MLLPLLSPGVRLPADQLLNGLQTHSANAAALSITGTISCRGDGTGLRGAGSGSALLMRSCLLLSHQYFAVMCIPDAADRLWLSSETQINSNRAISPSLGISARGSICLRSRAWLGARAVPGNGLATLSRFYGACSGGVELGGPGGGGCCVAGHCPKEKILLCHSKAGQCSSPAPPGTAAV